MIQTDTTPTLALAEKLLAIESVTPNDNGAQMLIREQLEGLGFRITDLSSGDVTNTWAEYGEEDGPLFVFSGHTDVVPAGPLQKWTHPPFQGTVQDNCLFGRGAADMKGALAAMLIAIKEFIQAQPAPKGRIGVMLTSDEEGDATEGTVKIVEYLLAQNKFIDWCLIGEATSNQVLGDVIKIGRRGSLHGYLQVIGKQGHVAYPQLADNPIHRCFKALDVLTQTEWDQGDSYFDPTTMQIYNIQADTGASNIIPGSLNARFNFRFSPCSNATELQQRVKEILNEYQLNYRLDWNLSSQPFLSKPGKLTEACQTVISTVCGVDAQANTAGGTSDGRFITELGCEIVELGVRNHCIHQVNEHVGLDELEQLTQVYRGILQQLL